LKVGQKVSTTNKQQGVAHTVTADEAPSITVCRGDVFVRLHWGGTFAYRCTIHPSMHAFNESSVDPG
jgi:plastocyanin